MHLGTLRLVEPALELGQWVRVYVADVEMGAAILFAKMGEVHGKPVEKSEERKAKEKNEVGKSES
jgi:hypothetical protein